jgi:signal peptidase I
MKALNYVLKEWIVPIVVAFVIVLLLNKFVFVLVTVPSGSMERTIMPGDRLFVTKLFDKDNLETGDIIVFNSDELEKVLVKRLIGLPQEEVYIDEDGKIYIDGVLLDEPYTTGYPQSAQIFQVPEDNYLFLGDCRSSSHDGRTWEDPYIPKDKLMGVALFRFFPFNRIGKIE